MPGDTYCSRRSRAWARRRRSRRTARHLVDVARLAIARIDPTRAKEVALQRLPGPIKQLYSEGNGAGIAVAIERALASDPQRTRDAIITLYMLNDAVARPAVLAAR